jgi:ATP phosphoribosyltransferase
MTLSIALPNKGALHEGAAAIFKEAGYQLRRDSRDLSFYDAKNGIEFFYLRPRDIATYVASGDLDLGVTGRDSFSILESRLRSGWHWILGEVSFASLRQLEREISQESGLQRLIRDW